MHKVAAETTSLEHPTGGPIHSNQPRHRLEGSRVLLLGPGQRLWYQRRTSPARDLHKRCASSRYSSGASITPRSRTDQPRSSSGAFRWAGHEEGPNGGGGHDGLERGTGGALLRRIRKSISAARVEFTDARANQRKSFCHDLGTQFSRSAHGVDSAGPFTSRNVSMTPSRRVPEDLSRPRLLGG